MTDHFLQPNKEHPVSEKDARKLVQPIIEKMTTPTITTTTNATTTTTTKTLKYSNTKDSPISPFSA